VHGIGTAEPLDMIQEVTDAMRVPRPGLVLSSDAEVHEVPDAGRVRHLVIRHGTIPGANVRFGTAHWADITYYRQGFLALIGSLLMTAFGVRFFADVAARDARGSGFFERALSFLLRHLLNIMVVFLAVVVFPITFASLLFSLSALVAEYAIRNTVGIYDLKFVDLQRWFIVTVSVLGCGICAWIGIVRVWPMRRERTLGIWIFSALGLTALAVGAMMPFHNAVVKWPVWVGEPGQHCGLFRDCLREYLKYFAQFNPYLVDRIDQTDGVSVFLALFNFLQIISGAVMLGLIVAILFVLAVYVIAALIAQRRFHTMVFAAVSTVTIWIVLLVVLWPENLINYSAMLRYTRPEAPQNVSAMFLWWETFPWRFYAEKIPAHGKDSIEAYYPIQWFEGAYFVLLCATVLLILSVLLGRWIWCTYRRKANLSAFRVAESSRRPRRVNWPRLIIARGYVVLVVLFIIYTSVAFLMILFKMQPLLLDALHIGTPDNQVPPEVFFHAEWVRLAVIAFVTFFLFYSHAITDGIKLVLDVVNHFTQPNKGYPVRARIEKRFDEIIDHLLAPGDKPHLVIVAHSQGTVITLDALMRHKWVDQILERAASLTLLTFGSPVSHVYQYYFPRLYPDLSETNLPEIANNPRVRWVNAYRIDDYVGTYIENSIPNFPVNVPLPVGGHTAYWRGEVMRRVLAEPALHDFLLSAIRYDGTIPVKTMEPSYFA
jgi:hypothetical protein